MKDVDLGTQTRCVGSNAPNRPTIALHNADLRPPGPGLETEEARPSEGVEHITTGEILPHEREQGFPDARGRRTRTLRNR